MVLYRCVRCGKPSRAYRPRGWITFEPPWNRGTGAEPYEARGLCPDCYADIRYPASAEAHTFDKFARRMFEAGCELVHCEQASTGSIYSTWQQGDTPAWFRVADHPVRSRVSDLIKKARGQGIVI